MKAPTTYSPALNLIYQPERNAKCLIRDQNRRAPDMTFLALGSGPKGHRDWAEGYRYYGMEYGDHPCSVRGDAHALPFSDESFDVVLAYNVFEHLKRPWIAALEVVRILRSKGLACIFAPFAWRYHPFPIDYWRFSHAGLASLFEPTGQMTTEMSGYDAAQRRVDSRGGKCPNLLDVPPVDEMGGWRENWEAVYVGRKQ